MKFKYLAPHAKINVSIPRDLEKAINDRLKKSLLLGKEWVSIIEFL